MALSAKLQVRQSQSLVMTPQLMQSIRLLQFSHLELSAFISREMEKNPLLELTEENPREDGAVPAEPPAPEPPPEAEWVGHELETSVAAIEARLDTSLENVFDADTTGRSQPSPLGDPWKNGSGGQSLDGDAPDLDAWCARPVSLAEHLHAQTALGLDAPADRLIASEIIDSLDDDGYLRRDCAEIAAALGASQTRVEAVLAIVQTFEPCGVGARNLAECLSLQLVERHRLDPAMAKLLANLELLARRDFTELCRICGVDRNDIADMVREIRELDPKPGHRFNAAPTQPVTPDVLVQARADGAWQIELNTETLPRVLVNRTYYSRVARTCRTEADKIFMTDCLQSANWLVRSLDQRAQTILKVATEIVKQQDMFMAYGVEHLRPLNLKTVADAIKMHESTVSRVTANKYMLTPRGLFELKYFFTQAIAATGGDASHSAETVRHRIRQLIEAEKAQAVLSDDALVDLLKKGGVDIARRTVAKYRESMNIPSSVQRRREKQAFSASEAV